MILDSSIRNALIRDICTIHGDMPGRFPNYFNLGKLDAKIQQFIKEYSAVRPEESAKLLKAYQDLNIAVTVAEKRNCELIADSIKTFEKVIIKSLSDSIPEAEIEKRIAHQDRFTTTFSNFLSTPTVTIGDLQKILNEGPVDLDACKTTSGLTLIQDLCTYEKTFGLRTFQMLEFLLKNGATINKINTYQILHAFNSKSREIGLPLLTDDLLELMMSRGLDINAVEWHGYEQFSLLGAATRYNDYKTLASLIFHGIHVSESFIKELWEPISMKESTEMLALREDVLIDMQKPSGFLISDMEPSERALFNKRCQDIHLFRSVYRVHKLITDQYHFTCSDPLSNVAMRLISPVLNASNQKTLCSAGCFSAEAHEKVVEFYQKDLPNLEKRINVHDKFTQACLEGKLDVAAGLLKEGHIDIDACFVPRKLGQKPSDGKTFSTYYPLLNHACLSRDTNLMEFLIKAGVNVNAFDACGKWMPALMEIVLFYPPSARKNAIMNNLRAAGANIKKRFGATPVWKIEEFIMNPKAINSFEILEALFHCEVDLDTIQYIFVRQLKDPDAESVTDKELLRRLMQAMIYYGVKVDLKQPQAYQPYIQAALAQRHKVISVIMREKLAEVPDLLQFSRDVLGIAASYIDEFSPEERPQQCLNLYKKCTQLTPS